MGMPSNRNAAGPIERIACSNSSVKSNLSLNSGPKAVSATASNQVMTLTTQQTNVTMLYCALSQ